ncbi:hypothetical protein BGX27_003936 [Mortierella sp. AM989]|nr:hypothetical protein BGX27_003936 [Mortierella sp. AM989]
MSDQAHEGTRKVAVLFIGNAGAGKSTLLSQIGGNFDSGAKFRSGFTKEISEKEVELEGEMLTLIDIPGLFEPDVKNTRENAKKLTEALRMDYDFKLFFVLKAHNTGVDDADLQMMAKVNECVQQANSDLKVVFRVIINQILEQRVEDIYKAHVVDDKFQGLFKSTAERGINIDVNIDQVTLIRFNKKEIDQNMLAGAITEIVKSHAAVRLDVKDIILDGNGQGEEKDTQPHQKTAGNLLSFRAILRALSRCLNPASDSENSAHSNPKQTVLTLPQSHFNTNPPSHTDPTDSNKTSTKGAEDENPAKVKNEEHLEE